ncbi:homologous recombination OB-fold protein [Pelobates fuscus]|uniref:homologous recombination OB-fold protein n=1 Tax=Pelobates fuscus TaxID=191477 RepID=UPI002FE4DC01
MAMSYQNLFSLESEEFDDEDFVSVLEDAESKTPTFVPPNIKLLRPISHNAGQALENPHGGGLQPCSSTHTASPVAQDVDDEELLSMCSELEEVRAEPGQLSQSRSFTEMPVGVSKQNSFSNVSSTNQWCPNENTHFQSPRPCLRDIPGAQPGMVKSFNIHTSSPHILQEHCVGGRFGQSVHTSSVEPSAKRPCFRIIPETSAKGPAPAVTHSSPHLQMQLSEQHRNRKVLTGCTLLNVNGQAGQHVTPIKHVHGTPQMSRTMFSSPNVTTPNSLQTPLVTNHLVQLVTAANQTSRRLSWETASPKERKFPGPAGLLPQQASGHMLEEIMVSAPHTPNHGARSKLCSKEEVTSQQPVEEDFIKGPWATMKAELAVDENDPNCFLRTYSVIMVLRKAALKQLQKNKVPRMAVTLKSLTPANGDASAVFRDPTGDIQGTIHHMLLEERESELKIGSVLLLQQVGVFSPSHRNHYLNVTPSNIVKIYPPGQEGGYTRLTVPPASDGKIDVNSNRTPSRPQPSSSTTLNKAPQISAPEDWGEDDLDALLWDMSEDPGD